MIGTVVDDDAAVAAAVALESFQVVECTADSVAVLMS